LLKRLAGSPGGALLRAALSKKRAGPAIGGDRLSLPYQNGEETVWEKGNESSAAALVTSGYMRVAPRCGKGWF